MTSAVKKSPRFFPWAIEKAIQGEHFLRYTEEDVLPRIQEALAAVRAEVTGGARRPNRRALHLQVAESA